MTRLDIRTALARLPEAQRVALVLVDLEDLPVAEVAELLGVPVGTVKSRCSRARTAMALMLRDRAAPARPARTDGGNRPGPGRVQAHEPSLRRARDGEGW